MQFRKLRAWLVAALLAVFSTSAAPYYETTGAIGVQQTGGPFLTDIGGGLNRWVTPLRWTNNGAETLTDLFFLLTLQLADTGGGVVNMTWDNADGRFELGASHSTEDNAAFFLAITTNNTNAGISPGFGVDPGDSLPMFSIGDLAPGAFVDTEVNFVLTNDIFVMFFNGAIVDQVPLPGTLALLGLGLAGFAFARRSLGRKV